MYRKKNNEYKYLELFEVNFNLIPESLTIVQ